MGFASGILNIIPYLGPFIGDLLAVVMALIFHINNAVEMPLLIFLIIVLAIFIVTQFIDNYVFQPLIYSPWRYSSSFLSQDRSAAYSAS